MKAETLCECQQQLEKAQSVNYAFALIAITLIVAVLVLTYQVTKPKDAFFDRSTDC